MPVTSTVDGTAMPAGTDAFSPNVQLKTYQDAAALYNGRKIYATTTAMNNETYMVNGWKAYVTADNSEWVYNGTAWVSQFTDSGWLALTMSGGWVAFGSGYASPEYRKLNGIVYMRGLVKSGATTGTVATLPAGFRPGGQNQYPAVNNNAPFVLQVNTTGAIVIAGTASSVSLSLALAPFPADN